MRLSLIALCLLLPGLVLARQVSITGEVTTESSAAPLAGVNVSILEPAGLLTQTVATDPAGQFRMPITVPEAIEHRSGYVVLRFEKDGLQRQDIYLKCDLRAAPQCAAGTVALPRSEGASALSEEEQDRLRPHRAPEGSALIVMPYRMIAPPSETAAIDMELFRFSLETAINTRIQELEQDHEVGQFSMPLPPVGLVALEKDFEDLPLHKQQAVGQYVSALAVISGIGQWRAAQDLVSIQSNFFVMPPEAGSQTRLLRVRDADLPATAINSIELADNLSPMWGHFALVAVAGREYVRAKAAGDKENLRRVRAYLIAERGRLREEEIYKKKDLDRLLETVQQELER